MSLIDQTHAEVSPADTRRDLVTLSRVTGTSGVVTLVIVLGSSLLNGYQNQPVTEGPAKIIPFFRSVDDRVGWASSWGTSVGLIAMLFFMVGLAMIMRQYERGLPWRTTFLAAAGVVSVVSGQIASWDAAAYRSRRSAPRSRRTRSTSATSLSSTAGRPPAPSRSWPGWSCCAHVSCRGGSPGGASSPASAS